MAALQFHLHAAGVLAPGLASLADLLGVSKGERSYAHEALQVPAPAMLPASERRRSSAAVRLVLACIDQALRDWPLPAEDLHSVFATDEGTGEIAQQMLGALATTRQVSPLTFSNSVINAPSGYFSIAWRNRQPSNAVSLGLESFASGLLCAVSDAHASGQALLLVAYDPPMAPPLDELLPVREGTASAWILSAALPVGAPPPLASFTLELVASGALPASALPAWMPPQWHAHSSAFGLAALGLLAQAAGAECRLALGNCMVVLRRTSGAGA